MKLLLKLIQQNINSYEEVKELSEIQQKQLEVEMKSYFGKKTSLKVAFKEECIADFWHVTTKDQPDQVLFDFWQINSDSGGVFFTNTANVAGVEMIQGSFDVMTDFAEDKNVIALAHSLSQAEKIKQIKSDYVLNQKDEVVDFKSEEFIPADPKLWAKFLKNQIPSEELVRKYHAGFNKACWDLISTKAILSETFLVEFAKKINWALASQHQKLSGDLMRMYKDKLDWIRISLYQELSEDFIREQQSLVNWDYLCGKQKLSESFIREFKDKVAWHAISWGQKLSDDFIREYQDQLDWKNMFLHQKFSEKFLKEFVHKYDWSCWANIAQQQNISVDFVNEFSDKINWNSLSMNLHLTDEHLRTFTEKINWGHVIIFGRGLPEELLREFKENISTPAETSQFNWSRILQDQKKFPMSEEFRQEMVKKIQ